jgi:hypothetical protein
MKSRWSWSVALVFSLLAAACADNPSGPSPHLEEQVTLAPGETVWISGTPLRLQFIGVTGDSRCPADLLCILGGDALVNIHVKDNRSVAAYELHTGDSSRASVLHAGYRIELVQLQPYPFSSGTIEPDEYRATLKVSK